MIKIQNTPNMADPKIQEEEQKILEEKIQEYAGKVEEYVDPEKLEWFGAELKQKKTDKKNKEFVSLSKGYVTISAPLGRIINPEDKEKINVKIGFSKNGSLFAIKAEGKEEGLPAVRNKQSPSLRIKMFKSLRPMFAERGWPEKGRQPPGGMRSLRWWWRRGRKRKRTSRGQARGERGAAIRGGRVRKGGRIKCKKSQKDTVSLKQ